MYRRKNKTTCNKKNRITDPHTRKCIKLSMKGSVFDKYMIPYISGNRLFLESFSDRDQRKFF